MPFVSMKFSIVLAVLLTSAAFAAEEKKEQKTPMNSSNDHGHERDVISMARGPDPDSAGSQFFICLAPVHRLDHQYTTFGKLIKGDDVLEKIGDTAVTRNSVGEMSQPTKRVVIESIKIAPADSVK